jgi:hypothetical protein
MENTTQPTQITIADLDTLKNIVDLASSRGAFRGAELTQVGAIYDKLTAFLNGVIAQAQAQQEAQADQDTSSADTTESTDTPSQGE